MVIRTCAQAAVSTSRCGFWRLRMQLRKLLICVAIVSVLSTGILVRRAELIIREHRLDFRRRRRG